MQSFRVALLWNIPRVIFQYTHEASGECLNKENQYTSGIFNSLPRESIVQLFYPVDRILIKKIEAKSQHESLFESCNSFTTQVPSKDLLNATRKIFNRNQEPASWRVASLRVVILYEIFFLRSYILRHFKRTIKNDFLHGAPTRQTDNMPFVRKVSLLNGVLNFRRIFFYAISHSCWS